jgi:hypothetical protein
MVAEVEKFYFKVLIFHPFVCDAVMFVPLANPSHQISPSHTHTHSHAHVYIYTVHPKISVKRIRKKNGTNKLIMLVFNMILILHNTLFTTFIKPSGKCQERPL